jgi:ABC-type dipeptide/oligopeptide/nickel transport system permease component
MLMYLCHRILAVVPVVLIVGVLVFLMLRLTRAPAASRANFCQLLIQP